MVDSSDGGVFARQAAVARAMGSPFTARVLDAVARQLSRAPKTARRIADWPGDRQADNVSLRLNGALHALARKGATSALAELYREREGDVDAVVGEALAQEDDAILRWLDGPPQTNEVGRSAAIWSALMQVSKPFGPRMELLELGSSAGLNLNLALYAYDLADVRTGSAASPLRLAPEWRGPAPAVAPVEILQARGVDISPLDVRDPVARERLLAFVWPDDTARLARLEQALRLAADHLPRIDRGHAADWLETRLAEPQAPGVTRVVFHSIVLQYLEAGARARVREALAAAGRRATNDTPLAHIAFEWDAERGCAVLELTTWPDGRTRELATCQAHAAWISWNGV